MFWALHASVQRTAATRLRHVARPRDCIPPGVIQLEASGHDPSIARQCVDTRSHASASNHELHDLLRAEGLADDAGDLRLCVDLHLAHLLSRGAHHSQVPLVNAAADLDRLAYQHIAFLDICGEV